jgi:hypothetical protein
MAFSFRLGINKLIINPMSGIKRIKNKRKGVMRSMTDLKCINYKRTILDNNCYRHQSKLYESKYTGRFSWCVSITAVTSGKSSGF